MLTGPIVWAAHLTIVYSAHALLCALAAAVNGARAASLALVIIMVVTMVALVALFLVVWSARSWRRFLTPRSLSDGEPAQAVQFMDRVMVLLALLSAVGVAWAGATALMLEPCEPLR